MSFWNFFKKAKPKPQKRFYSMYGAEGRKILKEAFKQKASNKLKEEEIKESELEIREESLEVKRAKLKRDKLRYLSQADEYGTFEEEEKEESEEKEEGLDFDSLIESATQNLFSGKNKNTEGVKDDEQFNIGSEREININRKEDRRRLFGVAGTKKDEEQKELNV